MIISFCYLPATFRITDVGFSLDGFLSTRTIYLSPALYVEKRYSRLAPEQGAKDLELRSAAHVIRLQAIYFATNPWAVVFTELER
jgi:hypothetical protein